MKTRKKKTVFNDFLNEFVIEDGSKQPNKKQKNTYQKATKFFTRNDASTLFAEARKGTNLSLSLEDSRSEIDSSTIEQHASSQAPIASLKKHGSATQGVVDGYRRGLEYYANPNNPSQVNLEEFDQYFTHRTDEYITAYKQGFLNAKDSNATQVLTNVLTNPRF